MKHFYYQSVVEWAQTIATPSKLIFIHYFAGLLILYTEVHQQQLVKYFKQEQGRSYEKRIKKDSHKLPFDI
ncbi:MAG: hypothetical protein H7Y86_19110 [Rhizobacter sp.]|nr:hypothetical protein [Ferruginibacter sp.]